MNWNQISMPCCFMADYTNTFIFFTFILHAEKKKTFILTLDKSRLERHAYVPTALNRHTLDAYAIRKRLLVHQWTFDERYIDFKLLFSLLIIISIHHNKNIQSRSHHTIEAMFWGTIISFAIELAHPYTKMIYGR